MSASHVVCVVLLFVFQVFAALPSITVVQTAQNTGDRLSTKASIPFGDDFSSNAVLQVNTTTTYQTILGFGGAITEASASVYANMNAANKKKIIDAYYGADGLHYTVGRVHMNSCDFSVASYSEDDQSGDYTLSNFTITHDEKWLIPFIKDAFAASSANINLFLTPWSPPAWMKQSGKMDGSTAPGLKQDTKIFQAWALFFSKFITAYKAHNINYWGLTVQNEPENAGSWESCVYSAEQERDFLKNYLGPQIKKDHPEVNIMIFDHNKDHMVTWAKTILGDAQAAQYVWGTAFHWYSGPQFANVAATHAVDPSKHLLATEACNCGGVHMGDWSRGESYGIDILGDLNNWAEGWVDWNVVLNPQGGPNHVQNFCDAPVIADASAQTVQFNVPYYYMGQFSKFILPKSVRVATTCPSNLQCTAFLRPDNVVAVVVLNTGNAEVTFKLLQRTGAARVTIPAHGITTLTYPTF